MLLRKRRCRKTPELF